MAKMDAKEVGFAVLLGSGVVILTPIFSGWLVGAIDVLSFELIPNVITAGAAISAGGAALLIDLGIQRFLR